MYREDDQRQTISIDRVCVGMHVRLDSWLGHPFLLNSFKIKDPQELATLRSLGLREIEYLPHLSDPESPPAEAPAGDADLRLDELMEAKQTRIRHLSRERERIRAAEKKYVLTGTAVANVMRIAAEKPIQAAELSGEIAVRLADVFLSETDPFIHLMGDQLTSDRAHLHGLNVAVLSLILARALGIGDAETMRDLAQGALLHDIGKLRVPSQILLKDEALSHAEARLLQMHPSYGLRLMLPAESLSRRVREIILFHHRMADGSGYPLDVKPEAIDRTVGIVSIANAYDNLCNPRLGRRARTPAEALSFMYKHHLSKYDKATLSAFIKSLGIYPPGTIVSLKSGKIGIVMTVDSSDLLNPNLMIYDPAVPKENAAIVNLRRDLHDGIERTVRPARLPAEVYDYLSPRKRICYFIDGAGRMS